MKRITILILLANLTIVLALSACSGGSGTELKGQDRDAVLAYTEPVADNLLKGLVENNYAEFSRDMNQQMLDGIKQPQFETLKTQLDNSIGAYQSRQVDSVIDYGKVVTVYYKGSFSKASRVILITFTKSEPHQVTGLYFR